MLLASVHCRSQDLKTCKFIRNQVLEKVSALQEPDRKAHGNQKAKSLPPTMSLQSPLLIMLNIVPADKAKIFKGHRSIFTEQAKFVN